MIELYFEILSKPRAEITMIDQMIVALPVWIIILVLVVYFWIIKEK